MSLRSRIRDVTTITALLTSAEAHAKAADAELPAAEHLVLAALELPDGSAAQSLRALGADPTDLAAAVQQVHAAALGMTEPMEPATLTHSAPARGAYRCTASAQQVFQRAGELARSSSGGLSSGHVLAAACELRRGTFPLALERLGVDREQLGAASLAATLT
jgi:ATP-dependent Clp protease ATP-binding subunit ClpA